MTRPAWLTAMGLAVAVAGTAGLVLSRASEAAPVPAPARATIGEQRLLIPRPTAAQAIRQVSAAVAAQLQYRLLLEEPIVAHQRETTAEHAGTARVGKIPIALDAQRRFGFDDFDRVVGEVDDAACRGVLAVVRRASAPGAEQELEKDEGAAIRVIAAEADPGIAADFAGEDAIGGDLRQRSEHDIGDAKAGQAACRHRGRHHRIDDGSRRRHDLDRPEVALVVRGIAADEVAHAGVDRGLGEGNG